MTRLVAAARALRRRYSAKTWVAILLLPVAVHGVLWFGPRAALVIALSVGFCVAASVLPRWLSGVRPVRLLNPGTVVTGLLLGLTLSAETPVYMIVVGALVAELPAKAELRGLGRNLLNPAAAGRGAVAILELIDPPAWGDLATGSSPLFKDAGGHLAPDALSMLFGMGPGAIGEPHALLLLVLAVPMLALVALKRHAALAMLIAVPLLVLVLPAPVEVQGHAPWVTRPSVWLVGGPTLLYATFFLTDPRTTPSTRAGLVAFGLGVAVLGVLGRLYTTIPGPEMWAILVMNVATVPLDRWLGATSEDRARPGAAQALGASTFLADGTELDRMAAIAHESPLATPARAFDALEAAVRAGDADALVREMQLAGVTGCGGAHFPVAEKWRAARAHPGPRTVLVNAQEGEPGTRKDRLLLQHHADEVIEGALLAAVAVEADEVIAVVDPAFTAGRDALTSAAARARARFGPLVPEVTVRPGPGLYVCGEETALIAFLEGERAEPRPRPPHPTERGLRGRPTVTHNVETLYWVATLLREADGRSAPFAHKLVTVSGAVQRPGVYRARLGAPLAQVIDLAGGLAPGATLAAFAFGGPTGALLPADAAQTPLALDPLRALGADLGTGSIAVLPADRCLVGETLASLRFHAEASCGRCTPCRVGTAELAALVGGLAAGRLNGRTPDQARAVATTLETASTCGLGRGAPTRLRSLMRHWPGLLEDHARRPECPTCRP